MQSNECGVARIEGLEYCIAASYFLSGLLASGLGQSEATVKSKRRKLLT